MRDIPRAWWICGCGSLLVITMLPLIRTFTREPIGENRCSLDGLPIEPQFRVRIVGNKHGSYHFCSLNCAEWWFSAMGEEPLAIYVTDEPTAEEIEISAAIFVRSQVVVHAGTKDCRHVFRNSADAMSHAAAYHGRILVGGRRPFPTFCADQRTPEPHPNHAAQ